jgi:Arc/MetJ family transcription regulator
MRELRRLGHHGAFFLGKRAMKPRHHLYLDEELSAQLDALSVVPGTSKSSIVSDALRQYLKHRGGNEQEVAIRLRLDRLSRAHERLSREMGAMLESLTLFVRFYMIQTAHLPDADSATVAKARARFESFIAQVGRAVAKNEGSQSSNVTEQSGQPRLANGGE